MAGARHTRVRVLANTGGRPLGLGFDRQGLLWIADADHNNGFIVGGDAYRKTLRQAIFQWTGFKTEVE